MTRWFEVMDLNPLFYALGWAGAFLSVILMQVVWHSRETTNDPLLMRWLNRLALTIFALSLAWAMNYATSKGWQPWPPLVAVIAALDFYFLIGIVTVHLRTIHRQRQRPPSLPARDHVNKPLSPIR